MADPHCTLLSQIHPLELYTHIYETEFQLINAVTRSSKKEHCFCGEKCLGFTVFT